MPKKKYLLNGNCNTLNANPANTIRKKAIVTQLRVRIRLFFSPCMKLAGAVEAKNPGTGLPVKIA
jgi:hypothetical protein